VHGAPIARSVLKMNVILAAEVLLLISVANSVPLFIRSLVFNSRATHPVDGGIQLPDGRFLFGPTKTVEGLVFSIAATALAAYLMGLALYVGLLVSIGAMAGDLASSFIKRRLALAPSSKATGLDQIPEALAPSLLAASILPIRAGDVAAIVGVFFCGEMILSWMLYQIGMREQPY
jgi:CDP-2,3-bis-(O-geranylgeranyl)-sn-glycerol synthase